jgi:membrane protein DedA with SNARE-associated domain
MITAAIPVERRLRERSPTLWPSDRLMQNVLNPSGIAEWLSTWGYLGVFICVFIGNVGIPIPEETVLLAAGFLAGRHSMDLRTLYAVGIVSASVGDCAGFLVGRTGGKPLLEQLAQKYRFARQHYDRLQTFFQEHGNKAVFLARFVAGARSMAGPMAGATGMPFWRFLGWNLLGACIWCPVVITVGYFLGNELDWVAGMAHRAGYWIAGTAVLALAMMWFFWRRKGVHSHPT